MPIVKDSKLVAIGSPVERFTRKMFTHIIQRLSAFLSENNFSISEVAALHIVGKQEGISVHHLSEQLNLSISATSRLISKLVDKGYFLRREDAIDKRAKVITCSKSGARLLDQMSLERVSAIFDAAETLPKQIPEKILSAVNQF